MCSETTQGSGGEDRGVRKTGLHAPDISFLKTGGSRFVVALYVWGAHPGVSEAVEEEPWQEGISHGPLGLRGSDLTGPAPHVSGDSPV